MCVRAEREMLNCHDNEMPGDLQAVLCARGRLRGEGMLSMGARDSRCFGIMGLVLNVI